MRRGPPESVVKTFHGLLVRVEDRTLGQTCTEVHGEKFGGPPDSEVRTFHSLQVTLKDNTFILLDFEQFTLYKIRLTEPVEPDPIVIELNKGQYKLYPLIISSFISY